MKWVVIRSPIDAIGIEYYNSSTGFYIHAITTIYDTIDEAVSICQEFRKIDDKHFYSIVPDSVTVLNIEKT